MKKHILYFLALSVIFAACTKNIATTLSYSVTDVNGNPLGNVYIPDSGTYTLPVEVRFLTGNTTDSVKISVQGLPANITVTPDAYTAKPTYTGNFTFNIGNAAPGTYPVSIKAYTRTTGYTTYNFNLIIVPVNCASAFNGTFAASSACSASKYTYTSAAATSGGTLNINNFGGYGTNTTTNVRFNCDNGSLTIPAQNIGNGVTVQGTGTFTNNTMVISYTASNIPAGGSDACTVTFTK